VKAGTAGQYLPQVMQSEFSWACTSTVDEALEQLEAESFDAILVDLNLPDSKGLNTFLKLQSSARQIPILVLTELDNEPLAMQAVQAGAQDYIVKEEIAIRPLARSIHHAVERRRLQAELQSLSLRDGLTGLYNRRGIFMLAEEQLKLLHRSAQGLLLFLCDVDGMKQINDTFGESHGDQALIDTAVILRMTFRNSDIIARLGGDEFVILAIDTLPATAELLQARLQENLNTHNIRSNRRYELSISIGMAYGAPEEYATLEELIAKAYLEMS
jgi:diguanylate cyclase (GGDEF)-like protein